MLRSQTLHAKIAVERNSQKAANLAAETERRKSIFMAHAFGAAKVYLG